MTTTTLRPVRIVTTLRTSSCPEGRVIEDRIIAPLSAKDRRAGKKDELREWYRTFGCVRPERRQHRRQLEKIRQPRKQAVQSNPSKDVQTEVYRELHDHLNRVATDLARQKVISYSDIEDVVHDLFRAAIDDLPRWNPEKSSRKTFLYESTALNKIDIVRKLNARKRQADYTKLSISTESASSDAMHDASGVGESGSVSEETIPETHSSFRDLEFRLALHDLIERLDADELLALDYLLQEFTQDETAMLMGYKRCTWRRNVLESIQMKAELCGFKPHKKGSRNV